MSQASAPLQPLDLRDQVYQECRAMAEYAFANGLPVPVGTINTIEGYANPPAADTPDTAAAPPDLGGLVAAHQVLANLIKPALPRTILLLDSEQKSGNTWRFLGPVAIIRQMMIASFVSMACFILLALSPDVTVGAGDILKSNGLPLLENLLFYIAAAGLGAGFAALYKANSYITQGTFDPTYHTSYWIRFFLGLIAGLVLSVMISDDALGGGVKAASSTNNGFIDPAFARPMLAMLGGFSADLLYTVLNRLVETVASLFQGSAKTLIEMKAQEAESQLAANKAQTQIDLAAKLVKLQQEVAAGANPGDIQAKIDALLSSVMPGSGQAGGN